MVLKKQNKKSNGDCGSNKQATLIFTFPNYFKVLEIFDDDGPVFN
jgi:hypothetical protein